MDNKFKNEKNFLSSYPDSISGVFDDKNIVLTFPVFSDIHLSGNDEHEGYFRSHMRFVRAIKHSKKYSVNNHLDLVCVAGDLGTCTNAPSIVTYGTEKSPGTQEEQYAIQSRRERENLLRGLLDTKDYYDKFFYCLGNHDGGGEKATSCIEYLSGKNKENFQFFYGDDLDAQALYLGNRHIKVKNYNFLALTPYPTFEDFDWLKEKLDAIIEQNPTQTIFLLHHFRPNAMTFLSDCYGFEIRSFLENYPQVIVFGGHTHTYVDFDNAIMQSENGFISVDAGSVRYIRGDWIVSKDKAAALNVRYRDIIINSTGLLVEVDVEGNIRIGRYNYLLDAKVGSSWVIPKLKSDGSRQLLYTKERERSRIKPIFSKGQSKCESQQNLLRITFPAAYSYQKIYNYKIEIIDNEKGEKVKSLYLSSLFYKYPTPADMPREYSIDIELESPFSNDYTIEITAADSWGNISEPLVFKG